MNVPRISTGSIGINYEISGEGDPLLLIMGFGMSGAAWVPILPFLQEFKCIYFDNRGTGNSDKPPGPYTIAQMAEDAANLINALNLDRVMLYGVSMGGMIAQELVLRHPDKISKVVLGCTLAGGPTAKMPDPAVIEQLMAGTKMMASDPEHGLDVVMPLLCPPEFLEAHPEIKDLMLMGIKMGLPTPPETAEYAMAGITQFDAHDRLAQVKCPVLVVHGDQDILVPPENAEIIKSQIPQAELYMIPGAGHAFQAIDPIRILNRITAWLRN